ncbi:MAG: cytochrome c maturation protein CcmE [Gammaproteobacteria bacterium]|nr:cytochrome c maturation protein CcmE [Gammaproteobacteria bacterium]
MRTQRKQRMIFIVVLLVGLSCATALALYAMRQNIMLFHTPSEVYTGKVPENRLFRIGGLVVVGSVVKADDGLTTDFGLTDLNQSITVRYTGLLPDLFREGQGIVAQGSLDGHGVFIAQEVLAKHDENYMPPEVAASLKQYRDTIPKGMSGYGPKAP